MDFKTLLFVGLCFFAAACEFDRGSDSTPSQDGTDQPIRDRLITARDMIVSAIDSRILVHVRRTEPTVAEGDAALAISSGSMRMHAAPDGQLVLDSIDLSLEEIDVTAADFPPAGVQVAGIHLRLDAPTLLDSRWTATDCAADGVAKIELILDWGIRDQNGQVLPLAPQRLRAIPAKVEVTTAADGTVELSLVAKRGDTFLEAGLFSLSDLNLRLRAAETAPVIAVTVPAHRRPLTHG